MMQDSDVIHEYAACALPGYRDGAHLHADRLPNKQEGRMERQREAAMLSTLACVIFLHLAGLHL